ncbi:Fc.00g084680.m01.CDS01 [Cosmosporella sp. VM-42]
MDGEYTYEPIDGPGKIRLLNLQPGVGDVHLTLSVVSLTDNPSYEALSYCWGDLSDNQTVYCDGKALEVTKSLFTALRQLRHPDERRVLWADAVCINQQDDLEKGSQVKLMSDIYAQPTRVLIWLGDDTSGLQGLKDSIRQGLGVLPAETHDAQVLSKAMTTLLDEALELRKAGKPNMLDVNWAPVKQLLRQPWFERKWVIQEVTMAGPEVPRLMICGDIEFPWADLASLTYRMGSHGLVGLIMGHSGGTTSESLIESFVAQNDQPARALHNAQIILMIGHYRTQATLLDGVSSTATFRCTDPRDHVYGLLSLAGGNGGIEPRYDLPVEEVYKAFATAMLTTEKNLKVLALAPHMAMSSCDHLDIPSWVPDLSTPNSLNTLISYTIRPPIFKAGGNDAAPVSISGGGNLLHLQGRIVDTVQDLGLSLYDMTLPPTTALPQSKLDPSKELFFQERMRLRDWIRQCQSVASIGRWDSLDEVQRRLFSRALMCDLIGMRDELPEAVLDAVPDYIAHLLAFGDKEKVAPEKPKRVSQYELIMEQSILTMTSQRRFCLTKNHRFGQVRREAKRGDLFCVILGAEVPYLIRPTGNGTYSLVGDCYLTDVMQGETLDDGRYETVEITLE